MTREEIVKFIEPYFKKPVLRKWEPCEFDLKYRFSKTPAGFRKLEATRERENARHLKEFKEKEDVYNRAMNTIENINTYPDAIRDLFYHSIEWIVSVGNEAREEVKKVEESVRQKYDVRKLE